MTTRNLFYDLPEEIQCIIYEYDSTHRDVMNFCFKDLEQRK